MPESVTWREKYGTRFVVNTALFTLVATLAETWFIAHVKPLVSPIIFSGVSVATFAGTAGTLFASFFPKADWMAKLAELLKSKAATAGLIATLPCILFAYATTFTVYLTAADGVANARLSVTANDKVAKPVELTSAEKRKAVSYFLAFRPVTARIETLAPVGYNPRVLPLRRGIPLELAVPSSDDRKKYYLVRLVPFINLFHLRGRLDRDPQYVLRVFLPGRRQPIVRSGLTFNAIYLGATLGELQEQAKLASATRDDHLHDTLLGLDDNLKEKEREGIIAAWLAHPEFIPTGELKQGETVRVVLESHAGAAPGAVTIAGGVNNLFLEAK